MLSRKSSNTIENIINNVFDDFEINENSWNCEYDEKLIESKIENNNLYEDDDDLEFGNESRKNFKFYKISL